MEITACEIRLSVLSATVGTRCLSIYLSIYLTFFNLPRPTAATATATA